MPQLTKSFKKLASEKSFFRTNLEKTFQRRPFLNDAKKKPLPPTSLQVRHVTPCSSLRCKRATASTASTSGNEAGPKKKSVHWKADIATWILMTSRATVTPSSMASSLCDECCCSDLELSEDEGASGSEYHEYESIYADETESELTRLHEMSDEDQPTFAELAFERSLNTLESLSGEDSVDGKEFSYAGEKAVKEGHKKAIKAFYQGGKHDIEKRIELGKGPLGGRSQSLPYDASIEHHYEAIEDNDFLTFPYLMRSSTKGIHYQQRKGIHKRQAYYEREASFKRDLLPPAMNALPGNLLQHPPKRGDYAKFFAAKSEEKLTSLRSPLVHLLPREELNATTLLACWLGDLDYLRDLCRQRALNLFVCDYVGASCFHYAARGGHVEILRFLVEEARCQGLYSKDGQGEPPCCKVPRSLVGATPLHDAASLGHLQVLQFLAKVWPKSLQMADDEGSTVMDVAARYVAMVTAGS